MIDDNSQTIIRSTTRRRVKKTVEESVNGDISNGQDILNGKIHSEKNTNLLDESWNVMDYSDYVDYRRRRTGTSKLDSSQDDGNKSPGFIFRYYKKFGYYWNVFPKTDYCYLPTSQNYHKEVSPGIPTVPNLSRYPLSSYMKRSFGRHSKTSDETFVSRFEQSETSITSSTPFDNSSTTTRTKPNWSSIEARQNLINSSLRNRQSQSIWIRVKRLLEKVVQIIKYTVITTYTTVSCVSSSAVSTLANGHSWLPLILFLLFFLPLMYFLLPETDDSRQDDKISFLRNQSSHFLTSLLGWLASVYILVKEFLLYVPTLFLQLAALFTFNSTSSSVNGETMCIDPPVKTLLADSPFPLINYPPDISEERLLAMQTEIVEKLRTELAGRNDHITSWVDRLQNQMVELAVDMKKMNSQFGGEWKSRFDILEGELAGLKKAVIDVRDQAIVNVAAPSEKMVERAVAKYHADRTGKPDYALQSSGGSVVRVRCAQTYSRSTAKYYLLGLPLPWDVTNGPDTIIKPGVMPGECWAFEGSFAQVTLQLATKVKVTAFSLEHSPRELALHGHISSAPKHFSVWALKDENDEHPVFLGRFTFLDNGDSLQQFDAKEYDEPIELIELKIESNHGHPEYTCLYRFRVHGLPPPV